MTASLGDRRTVTSVPSIRIQHVAGRRIGGRAEAYSRFVSSPIHPQVLAVALDRSSGQVFEDFVHELEAALIGAGYVPVGGVADGGADGVVLDHLSYDKDRPGHYLQTSIVPKVQTKIKKTVERLRQVGREPQIITFFTNREVGNVEQVEYDLTDELKTLVRIRDRRYITAHINQSAHTRAAYHNHLQGLTLFLSKIGAAPLIARSSHVSNPDAFVFLRQEVDRQNGRAPLVDAVVDALAVWALEGTDPDAGIMMTEGEVATKILTTFPAARQYVDSRLGQRLSALCRKTYPGGRLVRFHRNRGRYVLPFEARERIASDNAEDEAIRADMISGLRTRCLEHLGETAADAFVDCVVGVTIRTLQLGFEREGLEFAHFVSRSGGKQHYHYLSDALASAMADADVPNTDLNAIGDAAIEILRQVFYASREVERLYLARLSRTYSILFTMQSEPRLIEYFEEMSGTFYLYVGSDLIIRALSERYLPPADQMTRNMLSMARIAGATLVLAEPVLEEVVFHIRATDREFVNHIEPVEAHMSVDLARQASRILIRSYMYAKLGVDPGTGPFPNNWPSFVQQFIGYSSLHKPSALADMRLYLQAQFGFAFEAKRDLEAIVALRDVAELAEDLLKVKKRPELADNDALMCHAVYGRRRQLGEQSGVSEFGYRTWWLTGGETSIVRFAEPLVRANNGDRFMMRPEFLLNFISLSPRAAEARATFKNVFPTLLGIRIARRMDEASYQELMDEVEGAASLEEGRRQAAMAQLANALKSDIQRQYRVDFEVDVSLGRATEVLTCSEVAAVIRSSKKETT